MHTTTSADLSASIISPSFHEGAEYEDNSSLHNYRTEIPNIIFEMDLEALEFKAYCVIKMTAGDRRSCFKSNPTLAKEIGCCVPTVIKLKNQLAERGLIIIEKRIDEKGGNRPDLIKIVDIWPHNMMEMSKKYNSNFKEGSEPGLGGGVNGVNGGGKRRLPKQDVKEQDVKLIKGNVKAADQARTLPLKREQKEIFDVLKSEDLGADDETLKYLIRKYSREKILNCLTHLRREIEKGTEFKKDKIAFFRHCLAGKTSIITERCAENRRRLQEALKDNPWDSLEIKEKFVVCKDTLTEIPFDMEKEEFDRKIDNLFLSSR